MAATSNTTGSFDRRRLLQLLLWILVAPLTAGWLLLARRKRVGRARPLRLPAPTAAGVSFHGPVILVHDGKRAVALSARCPHLGCLINRAEGESLICPCHGSRFHLDGGLMRGPAGARLQRLPMEREQKDGTLIITID